MPYERQNQARDDSGFTAHSLWPSHQFLMAPPSLMREYYIDGTPFVDRRGLVCDSFVSDLVSTRQIKSRTGRPVRLRGKQLILGKTTAARKKARDHESEAY